MREILINVEPSYKVIVGKGLMDNVWDNISAIGSYSRVAIVSDSMVASLYLEKVKTSIPMNIAVYAYVFPHGESSKNLKVLSDIYDFLAESEITRSDLIIALGGGVTGDMVGFAASTYLRGVDFVNIPTTLLSMVDSSVGGKTAVNINAGKNQVGAFYQPKVVLCDTDVLTTLPKELILDGVGEITKYAVLENRGLFDDLLADNFDERLVDIVAKCVQIKNEYVSCDVFDKGKRQLLNLGHTLGHVVEKDSKFTIAHGRAVLIGLYMLTSKFRGTAQIDEILDKVSKVADRFGMAVEYKKSVDELWQCAGNDKKRKGDYITLARPYAIGDCRLEKVKVGCPIGLTEAVKNSTFDIIVKNKKLCGNMIAPPSKSDLHRLIICSAFCGAKVKINNVMYSDDILATIDAVKSLGASVECGENSLTITQGELVKTAVIDCRECGSTFRFLLPICAMLGVEAEFKGSQRLGERGYIDIIDAMKGEVSFSQNRGLPLKVNGEYNNKNIDISGAISSQFITGIILGSYAKNTPININIIGDFQSKNYVQMTIDTVRKFGVDVVVEDTKIIIKPDKNRKETSELLEFDAESDYSNGAFFSVAGVNVKYDEKSSQGDHRILDILEETKDGKAFDVSIKNIPDLAPILSVLATRLEGESVLRDCARLRYKECDRLNTMCEVLTKCGVSAKVIGDDFYIQGGNVTGGVTVDSYGDHRIAMAVAVLASFAEREICITNAGVVKKSYPEFWEDFVKMGGEIDVINIR